METSNRLHVHKIGRQMTQFRITENHLHFESSVILSPGIPRWDLQGAESIFCRLTASQLLGLAYLLRMNFSCIFCVSFSKGKGARIWSFSPWQSFIAHLHAYLAGKIPKVAFRIFGRLCDGTQSENRGNRKVSTKSALWLLDGTIWGKFNLWKGNPGFVSLLNELVNNLWRWQCRSSIRWQKTFGVEFFSTARIICRYLLFLKCFNSFFFWKKHNTSEYIQSLKRLIKAKFL